MTQSTWLRRVRNAVLFGSICFQCALASPAVNVALKASFPQPPLLLELLETAAEENATAYFPLLDRIADGVFKHAQSDEQLYNRFLEVLVEDEHLTDPQALSSWKLAVSLHSSAPRVEAQYQFYRTSVEPSLGATEDSQCGDGAWVDLLGKQYCSSELDYGQGHAMKWSHREELAFDRMFGNSTSEFAPILYADVTSDDFAKFHNAISKTAREGKTSYRVRYRPASYTSSEPLPIHGYGVSLDLKRTDYIVIDDRQDASDEEKKETAPAEVTLEEKDVSDVKKLTSAELMRLGLRAASFIMNADDKLDTFLRVAQDFPKHAAAISAFNVSTEFVQEHRENREQLLPPGFNVLWINGVQMDARKMNPFDLLEHLRRERGLISDGKSLGLSGREVIDMLSHPAITEAQTTDDATRYDWRDEIEGGNVIIWLNDIEKDKRYDDWSDSLFALLQRMFPGQMPPVRRDIHNMVMPIDFTDPEEVETVLENLQAFVKRKLPVRFGLVPSVDTPEAVDQAKMVYHVLDTYGLAAFLKYLEESNREGTLDAPHSASFDLAVKGRKVRRDREALPFREILKVEHMDSRVQAAESYLKRLGAFGVVPPVFINGVAIPRNDEWLQTMSKRVTNDLRIIQQQVFEDAFEEDYWIPGYFLLEASPRRNSIIVPEDEKTIKLVNMVSAISKHKGLFESFRRIDADPSAPNNASSQLIIIDNFDSQEAKQRLGEVVKFRKDHPGVEVIFIHNREWATTLNGAGAQLSTSNEKNSLTVAELEDILEIEVGLTSVVNLDYVWPGIRSLTKVFGLGQSQSGLVLNGRVVGPLNETVIFSKDDLETLLSFEQKKRIVPAAKALEGLELTKKLPNVQAAAMACSLISVSAVSDVPEGIFEALPTTRTNLFHTLWLANHTAITTGDMDTAAVQFVASIDPASELAQRWVPLLKAISEFDGVYMRLFLNPRDRLEELPVKRFYRYVLNPYPQFSEEGTLKNLQAEFHGIPSETLLTMAMDVPPSWLVAPKESIYDLDNIKLSSVSGKDSVDAVYVLENILIEGHSRDMTTGVPPRGAKLELGTEKNPHFADTTVMSNLGYFQFKANPGFYSIQLQEGRSREIWSIDSIGAKGWNPVPGDESTEIALTSFQGSTLYPRMSRNEGKEADDVLSTPTASAMDIAAKGAAAVDNLLSKVGLKGVKSGEYISQGLEFGSNILSKAGLSTNTKSGPSTQAEINIFSVASGHLYERMLNIMMVSVMRHTKHTVKFWFIEQFLSPSFKSFLPTMAAEYGFDYEMVTYKWPHWLRQQKEKQREIWGYKILFLDVLFPLDLDKVIFVDADQIVRTDMYSLVTHNLEGAPYGFTPMCDSRTEMEGFRFWKQGYWKNFLRGLPYHISALYVVDLKRFRQIAAGDRLRQQYHQLSADPNSLSNLDQDLPNNMQFNIPIHSLPQEWLWCETWCSDQSLADAKTIDLCNNPQTKEPKLERARRQVPEWTEYDDEIAALAKRTKAVTMEKSEQEREQEQEYISARESLASSAEPQTSARKSKEKDEL